MSSTPFLDFLNLVNKKASVRKKIYDDICDYFNNTKFDGKKFKLSANQIRVFLAGDRDGIYIEAAFEWNNAHPGQGGGTTHSGPTPMHTNPPNTWGS